MSNELNLEEKIAQMDDKLNQLLQMHSASPSSEDNHLLLQRENGYLRQALEISDRQQTLLQAELIDYQQTLEILEERQQVLQTEMTQLRQILSQQETQIEMLRQALSQSQEYGQELESQLAQVQKNQQDPELPSRPRPQGLLPEILAEQLGISTAEIFQKWRSGQLQGWHLGRDQRFYPAR